MMDVSEPSRSAHLATAGSGGIRELTARQQAVLTFVIRFRQEHGYSPSVREIGAAIGVRSPNAVQDHIRALAKKGAVTVTPGRSRTLVPKPALAVPLLGEVT